ncbi:ABC transporter ATP-binding protein [Cellulomonas timonensis]|uniref:ABC transporter ATP-binding protein n=1 Tax=Cellulomonas timonensis TaxID=1689271 RepID=UPI00082C55A4|nr:ABC transporter ATP-binding protein [Cellulomonas timonensis]
MSRSSPATAATERLSLHNVSVRFGGVQALDQVSLTVSDGEVVGLIGPNGAGKTTLFNVVCGIVRPTSGEVRLGGTPQRPVTHRLVRDGVARTLQGLGLFAGLTVRENVMAGLSSTVPGMAAAAIGAHRMLRHDREAARRAEDVLDELGVLDAADRRPGDLPYPVRKRVALARALVSEPALLLLDEPAGGLGAADIADLARTVRDLAATRGCAILLVEHHVDLVMSLCDRVAVLDFGRLIADGAPQEVRADPAVVDAYLGIEAPTAPRASGGAA